VLAQIALTSLQKIVAVHERKVRPAYEVYSRPMPRRLMAICAALTLWSSGSAYAAAPPVYYLALGDSLTRGVQPTRTGMLVETTQGYVDDLYAYYRFRHPELRLVKLGCSGETTVTMIAGGVCSYPLGSQLAEAIQFLKTHQVALVTLTIGGDNILHCISASGIDPACVTNGVDDATADLPQILGALRAAGPGVTIVAMNYNDPLLGLWRFGPAGQALATESLQITLFFNGLLEGIYGAFHVPVADVAQAFRITDERPLPLLDVPVNVFLALTWTWIGLPPPLGPDVHPNAVGYAVIAGAFVKTIGAQ
jgi:lysophospholipase L1-like esterase